jgi:intracellular septation protein A
MSSRQPTSYLTALESFSDKEFAKKPILERKFSELTVSRIRLLIFLFQHLFLEIALPLILYFTLKGPLGELYATIISSIPNLLSTVWTIVIKRRFEPLPMILIFTFFIGLGLSLGYNDSRLKQIQGPIVTLGIGITFLTTLSLSKPFIYYLSRPWITKNDLEKIKEFDLKWQNLEFRNTMKLVSIVWGTGFIIQAIVNLILVYTVNLDLEMILGNVLSFGTIGLLIVWSYFYRAKLIKEKRIRDQEASIAQVREFS